MRTVVTKIKIADRVFIALALLHRENPDREDFTIDEIVERAARENLVVRRARALALLHCVADRAANGERYRLLLSTDDWPNPEDLPPQYVELVEWALKRYGRWLEGIFRMQGMGRELWHGVDPDEYVRQLRD